MVRSGTSPLEKGLASKALNALRLYRRYAALQIRSQMEYKLDFGLKVLAVFIGTSIDFLAILILFGRFENIGGWRLPEVALLYGLVNLPFGFIHLVAEGFEDFRKLIRMGSFDQLLIRPRSTAFQVLGSTFPLRQLGRILQSLVVFGLALYWLDAFATWSFLKWLYLGMSLVANSLFFLGLVMMSATLCFWTVESVEIANIVTYGGTEMATYPMHIFGRTMRRVFTYIVPLAFVSYYPALYLLDRPDPLGLPRILSFIAPVACALIFIAGLRVWRFGVAHYMSTGS